MFREFPFDELSRAMSGRVKVGLIGAGVMGSNHARVVSQSQFAELDVVVDQDLSRAENLAGKYGAQGSTSLNAVENCDAVILASSTSSHFEIASQLLEGNVPLLVEKPLAAELGHVEELCKIAENKNSVLMCGFVERFNPAILLAKSLIEQPPLHLMAVRHSPHDARSLGSVIHDLLIHDIDLAVRMFGGVIPSKVTASAWKPAGGNDEIADTTLQFADGALATLSASRMGQRKIRSVTILTEGSLVEVDLLRADVTVYRNVRQEQVDESGTLSYRSETVIDIPFVRHGGEPLGLQFEHFSKLMQGNIDPREEISSIYAPHVVASRVEAESRLS